MELTDKNNTDLKIAHTLKKVLREFYDLKREQATLQTRLAEIDERKNELQTIIDIEVLNGNIVKSELHEGLYFCRYIDPSEPSF